MNAQPARSGGAGHAAASAHAPPGTRDAVWCELLRAAAAGQPQALADLYDETAAVVYGVARRIAGNEADAEEITLDVYTHVWRAAGSYDAERSSVLSWLVMLTRSRCLDRVRSAASRRRAEEVAGCPPVPAATEGRLELEQAMNMALAQLTPDQQRLLELAFYRDMSQSEMSASLVLPLGTVKTRMRAAMAAMRAALERLGYGGAV